MQMVIWTDRVKNTEERYNSTYPDTGYRIANYSDRLGPLGNFVENSRN
jgi:hypothetical protein